MRTSLFAHYEIKSAWTLRMDLTQPRKEAIKALQEAMQYSIDAMPMDFASMANAHLYDNVPVYGLQRHAQWGEVPEHRWYSKYYPAEYDYPWTSNEFNELQNKKKKPAQ